MFENMEKERFMVLVLSIGVMLFFIGIASYIVLGPSTEEYLIPQQVSSILKLTGMSLICISLIVGGFFIEGMDKDIRTLLLIFGVIFLLLSIFVLSSSR